MRKANLAASPAQILTPKMMAFAAASVVLGLIGLRLHVVQSESNTIALKAARESLTQIADPSFTVKDDDSPTSVLFEVWSGLG